MLVFQIFSKRGIRDQCLLKMKHLGSEDLFVQNKSRFFVEKLS